MHDPKKWLSFKKKYLKELNGNRAFEHLLAIAESTDPVTLVYSTSDTKHNSAIILRHYLEVKLRKVNRSGKPRKPLPLPRMMHPHQYQF
jgi:hypothetical protein